jgi:diadenosine tetraphosphate (Ap4A) HIT family hydrolase
MSSERQTPSTPPGLPLSGEEPLCSPPDKGELEGVEVLPVCELCNQVGGTLLWQDETCRVVLVEDADYPGFCRVIWKLHVKEMTDLSAVERGHLMAIVFVVEAVVREVMRPDKINLASLGNLTPHLHWHVIPRYQHDKHFPQPIWGAAQREGESTCSLDWQARLMESVRSKLNLRPC